MKRFLPALLLALGAAACKDSTGPETLEVGDVLTLNVNAKEGEANICGNPINRQARVVATSEHTVVLADLSNPANGFTDSEYQEFATEFERTSWPVVTRNFGTPSDVDENGRVLMLFTSAVNELTPRQADYIVGGFFYARDLFPRKDTPEAGTCASSNEREMFYLLAPDPTGSINGNARSKSYVRTSSFGTLSHEFQHLVNASRRLYVNHASSFEETWLDEGLSHIAEELSLYDATTLTPRQNIAITNTFFPTAARVDALNWYGTANLGRLNEYYADPSDNAPIQVDDDLATRGSAWQLLRYGADQRTSTNEQSLWFSLANATTTGITNLTAAFGDPIPLLQNWGVAIYTDDAVTGVSPTFTHPSWNFRAALGRSELGGFRLKVDTLTNGIARRIDMVAGGNAYLRVGVLANTRAEVRTTGPAVSGSTCPVTQLTAVGQVFQPAASASGLICLDGGTSGAEYTLIPFFASTSGTETAVVTVTALGVVRPLSGPNPVLSPVGPTLARAAAGGVDAEGDGGFETGLRARERRVLASLIGAGGPRRAVSAAAASEVRISVVRTK